MNGFPAPLATLESPEAGGREKIKRRVLIVDFVNVQKAANYDYLKTTIPDSLFEPLEKTKSFEILSRDKGGADALARLYGAELDGFDLTSESTAAEIGRKVEAEVVIIGRFVVYAEAGGDHILFQAKAVDVKSGKVKVARQKTGELSSKIFVMISDLCDDMANTMAKELPPVSRAEMKDLMALGYPVYIHLDSYSSLAMQNFKSIEKNEFGGRGDISQRLWYDWFNPIANFGASYGKGTDPVASMLTYFAQAGVTYPFRRKQFIISPFIVGGVHGGRVSSNFNSLNYLVPSFEGGINFDYMLFSRVGINLAGSYVMLLDSVLPGSVVRFSFGVALKL